MHQQLRRHLREPPNILNGQPLCNTSYLINSSKIVKGTKLKTQDFIKLQLLKYRNCSPNQISALPQTSFVFVDKTRIFEEVDNQEELRRQIRIRRENQSRQTRKRMKLFTNVRNNEAAMDEMDGVFKFELSTGPKAHTSYSAKRASSSKNYNQSNSYDLSNSAQKKIERNVEFRSDNLGSRKNEYLNSFALKDQRSQTVNKSPVQIQETSNSQWKTPVYKKKPNSYMRQWKKYFKVKMQVLKERNASTPFDSQGLSQSLRRQTNINEAKTGNVKHQQPRFYSMEVRTAQKQALGPNPVLQKKGSTSLSGKWTTPVLTKR